MARSAVRTFGGPKQHKETKSEKEKRMESNRIARERAKKFVIPGIIALIACVAFLFLNKYGLTGTKSKKAPLSTDEIVYKAASDAREQFTSPTNQDEMTKQILEALEKMKPEDFLKLKEDIEKRDQEKSQEQQEQPQEQVEEVAAVEEEEEEEEKEKEEKTSADESNVAKPEVIVEQEVPIDK
ncbi:hypothetical protein BGZ65_004707 [Modicella reniformis]|uniref:Uncharacterized protein n=1 Tax=Modicella reniformis TaxID=1440133 RepID=A0A9P6LTY4_9FUNG|nr:hypothetical protein BGZ65_004707 [Modicella reniformis]